MRRTILAALVVALMALAVPALATPPDKVIRLRQPAYRFSAAGFETTERPAYGGLVTVNRAAVPENHVPADVPSNENFGRAIYNHFGNPAAGQAVIETWTRVTYSDAALPITNQGFGSASRLRNVERIALRVILHTRGGTVSSGFSSAVCNNGNQAANPLIFNCVSPVQETGGLVPNPNFCETFTTVLYAIRWKDGSLSSGKVLRSPADLVNDTCRVN